MTKTHISAITIIIFLISFCFFLFGCDFSFWGKNMMNNKIQNIELNKMVKIEDLIDGQWEKVCVLVPYQPLAFVKDDDSENMKIINTEIKNAKLSIDEVHWHLVFKDSEEISFISEKISSFFSVKQGGFNDAMSKLFSEVNFSPLGCAGFNEAYFFKYKQNNRVYLSLGVKTI